MWPSEAPKDIPFERSSLFREAVGWSVFGTGDISILYPAWMVGMMIICLVMCALACGIYVDLYIYIYSTSVDASVPNFGVAKVW